MNKLTIEKKAQIINMLVEGNSMRSTSRMADVSIVTVGKLLGEVGRACMDFHNTHVVNLKTTRIECDEIWSFVSSKDKNTTEERKAEGCGDAWTWVGIDADSKLVVSWFVGSRSAETANEFMSDLKSRVTKRLQLTSDGLHAYLEAVTNAFGSQIDFAQLVKIYGSSNSESNKTERKYSPAKFVTATKNVICGNPDKDLISTSYVERQNLTMRMHMRRFTRLTNGFSKKLENHIYAIALHFVYYNFVKQHKTLRVTPAMAAGITKRFMSITDIAALTEPKEAVKKRRGAYKTAA